MDETLELIQRLSNERQRIWWLAGEGKATAEQRRRVQDITRELYQLWDTYRRELAMRHSRPPVEWAPRRVVEFPVERAGAKTTSASQRERAA